MLNPRKVTTGSPCLLFVSSLPNLPFPLLQVSNNTVLEDVRVICSIYRSATVVGLLALTVPADRRFAVLLTILIIRGPITRKAEWPPDLRRGALLGRTSSPGLAKAI